MFKIVAILAFAVSLATCGPVSTVTEGWKHAKAIESDLEVFSGVAPQVGFNWYNGRLVSVTVAFPRIYETKPLRELAEAVRASVSKQFKETPDNIMLIFSLEK